MLPPDSPTRSHVMPHVNLIQPTPDNSQATPPSTQLLPTPHRRDSVTDVLPVAIHSSMAPVNSMSVPAESTESLTDHPAPELPPAFPLSPSVSLIPTVAVLNDPSKDPNIIRNFYL